MALESILAELIGLALLAGLASAVQVGLEALRSEDVEAADAGADAEAQGDNDNEMEKEMADLCRVDLLRLRVDDLDERPEWRQPQQQQSISDPDEAGEPGEEIPGGGPWQAVRVRVRSNAERPSGS